MVNLPVEAGPLFLLLSIPDTRPFPSYKLEIVNRGTGRLVWKGEGLEASRLNEVSLILSRDALSSGDYQLRLYGLKGGNAELVEQYELRITHE